MALKRKTIIIIVAPQIECWGNFKKMCEAKDFPYHSLKMKPFPILFRDFVIHKIEFK